MSLTTIWNRTDLARRQAQIEHVRVYRLRQQKDKWVRPVIRPAATLADILGRPAAKGASW